MSDREQDSSNIVHQLAALNVRFDHSNIRVLKFEFGENKLCALGTVLVICVSSLEYKELLNPFYWYQSVVDRIQWVVIDRKLHY